MAPRGTAKHRSDEHETYIAKLYGGAKIPGSGSVIFKKGDVITDDELFECKSKGYPGKPTSSQILTWLEKIAVEAYSQGKRPVLAMRYFAPGSPLAGFDGWVDMVIRLAREDSDGY